MAVQTHQIIEVDCHLESMDREAVLSRLQPVLDEDDATLLPRIDRIGDECLSLLDPRSVYKLFNPAICTLPPTYDEPGIKLVGTMAVLRGKSVYDRMHKATHCVMLASTLGTHEMLAETLERFDRTERDRVIVGACLATLAERVDGMANAAVVKDALARGLYTDDRLEPGEGDFPLETQATLMFYTQAEKRLGMQVLDGTLLPPWSSIGVMGMYDKSQKGRRRACGRCKYRDFCSIRAIGMTCHGRKGSFS